MKFEELYEQKLEEGKLLGKFDIKLIKEEDKTSNNIVIKNLDKREAKWNHPLFINVKHLDNLIEELQNFKKEI